MQKNELHVYVNILHCLKFNHSSEAMTIITNADCLRSVPMQGYHPGNRQPKSYKQYDLIFKFTTVQMHKI